ncbi:hypothetical protein FJ976_26480 [Mesorhizobium sp. B1-1-9]|uniref:Uncharacterized protein n=1 Tax=Mesorhizobium opportunistum (strain LMG 24607 / HAMBI 3007 / WSM2075) TaxID=536019 RepID=F7YDY7_MESOW|nr:hypothetical protein Mesop_5742 [Mesorhizobium opportunistum WSM2075]TPN44318.1 hypothetical protein FJ976_26480 [Mesorhizobium sp. B1-1-9]TPN50546.1 hypothetical protein FJ978_14855 [Mesorhizobium sp. B1-1-7]
MSYSRHFSAAPHLPAGILSPYRDGERGALANAFANHRRYKKGAGIAASPLLPVPIRGEVPGRVMRGSAGLRHDIKSMRG